VQTQYSEDLKRMFPVPIIGHYHSHEQKVEEYKKLLSDKCGAMLYIYVLRLIGAHLGSSDDVEAIFQALSEIDWRFKDYEKGV